MEQTLLRHSQGRTIYVDDTRPLQGEVFVGVVGSSIAKGKLLQIDASEALQLKGVYGVYTGRDFKLNRWGNIIKDQPILAEGSIEYFGEPIAIIACQNIEVFYRAQRLLKIDLQRQEPLLDPEVAFQQGHILYQGKKFRRGSPEKNLDPSNNYVLKNSFYLGGQEQFYFENQSSRVEIIEDRIHVLSATQSPTDTQHVVADSLGVPFHKVICDISNLGGGFGGKETQASPFAAMAALCALKLNRPARIVLTKDQDMVMTGKRHPFVVKYEVGFDQLGKVLGIKLFFIADGGAYLDLSPAILDRAHFHADGAYYFENIEIDGVVVKTNHHSNTAMRGFGAPQAYFAIENIIHEIALILKKDPVEIRKINFYRNEDATPYGQILKDFVVDHMTDKILETSNYEKRRLQIEKDFQLNLKNNKIKSIALTTCKFGISFTNRTLNQGSSLVNLHLDGTVQVSTGVVEMGQGVNLKIKKIIAKELGISTEDVEVLPTSTSKNHNTAPTAASTGADLNGSATFIALQKIKARLALLLLEYWNCGEFKEFESLSNGGEYLTQSQIQNLTSQVVFENKKIRNISGTKEISLASALEKAFQYRVKLGELSYYKTPIEDKNAFLYFTQGVSVSEVEIDLNTGAVLIPRVDILMDIGDSIYESVDRGQITGAFMQSLGWLIYEKLEYSNEGQLLTHGPSTYKIPTMYEMPQEWKVNLFLNQNNKKINKNIYASKATGEPPYLLSFSVWLAVKEAISKYNNKVCLNLSVPATPEKILLSLI